MTFVQCVAPAEVLRLRALARERDPARISPDAGIEVVGHELARFEPLDEVDPSQHLVLRTDRRDAEAAIADLLALLDLRGRWVTQAAAAWALWLIGRPRSGVVARYGASTLAGEPAAFSGASVAVDLNGCPPMSRAVR